MQENIDGTWKVERGPDLPKPLFGHCAVTLPGGNVLLTGGFDGWDQSNLAKEFHWEDNLNGKWINEPGENTNMRIKRYDHLCFYRQGSVYAVGGWKANLDPVMKTERYNISLMKWEILSEDNDSELPDVLRSSSVGISEGKLALVGGVSCETGSHVRNGRKCQKLPGVYEFEPLQGWKKSGEEIETARSSHVGINIPITVEDSCN